MKWILTGIIFFVSMLGALTLTYFFVGMCLFFIESYSKQPVLTAIAGVIAIAITICLYRYLSKECKERD